MAKQIKQIQLRGISRSPSDRMNSDGGVAESLNMQIEEQESAPVVEAEDVTGILKKGDGTNMFPPDDIGVAWKCEYIHKTKEYENAILSYVKESKKYIGTYGENGLIDIFVLPGNDEIKSVSTFGNLVLLAARRGMYWMMCINGTYAYLGSEFPKANFDIEVSETTLTTKSTSIPADEQWGGWQDYMIRKYIPAICEAVKNKRPPMSCPFFIRMGIELVNGESFGETTPVLINADTCDPVFNAPLVIDYLTHDSSIGLLWKQVLPVTLKLKPINPELFTPWKDIISHINIYISIPFSGIGEGFYTTQGVDEQGNIYHKLILIANNGAGQQDIVDSCGQFKLIKRIPINTFLKTDTIEISEETIPALGSYDAIGLLDDLENPSYKSLHSVYFGDVRNYNSRLLAYKSTQRLYSGYPLTQSPIIQSSRQRYSFIYRYHVRDGAISKSVVSRSINGEKYISIGGARDSILSLCQVPMGLIAYPDKRCFKIEIWMVKDTDLVRPSIPAKYKEYSTITSAYDDCAFADIGYGKGLIEDMNESGRDVTIALDEINDDSEFNVANRFYSSEIDLPFKFTPGGYHTVPNEVVGLSVPTIPLSSGQAGEFKLYVFTTKGIYAYQVNDEGMYVNETLVTLDNAYQDTVLDLDQQTAYMGDKGLRLLSGMQVEDLSEVMLGRGYDYTAEDIEGRLTNLISRMVGNAEINALEDNTQFPDFAADASLIYDRKGQRVLCISRTSGYGYMYSFKSGTWHKFSFERDLGESTRIVRYEPTHLIVLDHKTGTETVTYIVTKEVCEEKTRIKKGIIFDSLNPGTTLEDVENLFISLNYSTSLKIFYGVPIFIPETEIATDLDVAEQRFNTIGFCYPADNQETYYEYSTIEETRSESTDIIQSRILDFSTKFNTENDDERAGVIVTRALDLGMPDVLKTINHIQIRGSYKKYKEEEEIEYIDCPLSFHISYNPGLSGEDAINLLQSMGMTTLLSYYREKEVIQWVDEPDAVLNATRVSAAIQGEIINELENIGMGCETVTRKKVVKIKRTPRVAYILLGSQDGINFHRLKSLRGKSWKMFRMIICSKLRPTERISWIDVEFEPRRMNKLR